jgi:hypothetical protein
MPAKNTRSTRNTRLNQSGFPLFPRLPPEIRLEIWRHARDTAADNQPEIFQLLPSAIHSDSEPTVFSGPPPELLLACREAHAVMLEPSSRTRPLRPEQDVVVVTYEMATALRYGDCTDWLRMVRHICFALPGYQSFVFWIADIVRHMRNLKTISVIFPKPKRGKLQIGSQPANISFHTSLNTWLRPKKLTSNQLSNVQVKADYWFDYGGACPPQQMSCSLSGDELFAEILQSLTAVIQNGGGRTSHCWDSRRQELKVEFNACSMERLRIVTRAKTPKRKRWFS